MEEKAQLEGEGKEVVAAVAFRSVATAGRDLVPGLGKSGWPGGGVGGQLGVIKLAPPVPVLGLKGNSLRVSRVPGVCQAGLGRQDRKVERGDPEGGCTPMGVR